MTRGNCWSFACTVFALLLLIFILPGATDVSGQGWTTGSAKPATGIKPTNSTKAVGAAKGTAKPRRVGNTAASSGQQPAPGTAAAPPATSVTTKTSRERRVTAGATSTKAPVANTVAKSTGSPATSARTAGCDPDKDERVDLSGTYNGNINYPAGGMIGDATLTITGNRFTLNSGSKSQMGNITAVATCNYTAVAMMFGQWKTPQPGEPVLPPLPMLSLSATKKEGKLSLKPSPSERREFSFEPSARQ